MGPVVIVIVQPPAQRLSAFPLRQVTPGMAATLAAVPELLPPGAS